jgi:aconitate hydratase
VENSYDARGRLQAGEQEYEIFRLSALEDDFGVSRLPYSLKVLLENLLRHEDGVSVSAEDVAGLAQWDPEAQPDREIAFAPARILMQDFTGVPAVVDLAAMRDAMAKHSAATRLRSTRSCPVDLVIDHSISADVAGVARRVRAQRRDRVRAQPPSATSSSAGARGRSTTSGSCRQHRHLPPGQPRVPRGGRVHDHATGRAYPDTVVGTDSHTPMVNGLGVFGWGVGGIEAEAAMLGQSDLDAGPSGRRGPAHRRDAGGRDRDRPRAVITEMLRSTASSGSSSSSTAPASAQVPLENRATIGNMTPGVRVDRDDVPRR